MAKKNEVTKADQATTILAGLKKSMAAALPTHLTADRMCRVVLTEMRKNPKLLQCSKQSLCGAIITASQLGLEPGVNGQCWIIPYKTEATFVPGYQGLIELAYRSGYIEAINGYPVYENDEFEYDLGNNTVSHKPTDGERGPLKYAWAWARVKGSSEKIFRVLNKNDISAVKASSKSASSSHSPWTTWEAEMWVKTAIKRLMKVLPKSSQMNVAIQADDHAEMIDVDVTVEDDPLSAGDHSFAASAPDEVVTAPTEIYDGFFELYSEQPNEVDESLAHAGIASMKAVVKQDLTGDDRKAWEKAKAYYQKNHG